MIIIKDQISVSKLKEMAEKSFGNMIKAVVDVNLKIMAVDAELHADEEALLIKEGSKNSDLWGINIYPELEGAQFIEFDSMINLRPAQQNRARGVEDSKIREQIIEIVNRLVKK